MILLIKNDALIYFSTVPLKENFFYNQLHAKNQKTNPCNLLIRFEPFQYDFVDRDWSPCLFWYSILSLKGILLYNQLHSGYCSKNLCVLLIKSIHAPSWPLCAFCLVLTALILLLQATSYKQKLILNFEFGATKHATYQLEKQALDISSIVSFSTPFNLKHFDMILLKKIDFLSYFGTVACHLAINAMACEQAPNHMDNVLWCS